MSSDELADWLEAGRMAAEPPRSIVSGSASQSCSLQTLDEVELRSGWGRDDSGRGRVAPALASRGLSAALSRRHRAGLSASSLGLL